VRRGCGVNGLTCGAQLAETERVSGRRAGASGVRAAALAGGVRREGGGDAVASGLSGVLLGRVGNLGRAREGEGAWAVRGKGKEEGWAGRAGALGQGEGGWIGLQGFGCWVGSSLFSFFFLPLFYF